MASSRGGLPRPSSLNLPPPDVGFTTMATPSANQQLPPPPAQWQSSDDAMQHWLRAKAEEDRRRQEEEKTRQETLRLEQRRVEQSMLRDSLQAGIPPHIIPLIFAGICQGVLPQPALELAQQYLAQLPGARGPNPHIPPPAHSHTHSQSLSHSQRPSIHIRQDSRSSLPTSYAPPPAQHVVPPPPNILLSQNPPPNSSAPNTPQPLGGPQIANGTPDARTGTNPWMNSGGPVQAQSVPINLGNVQYAPGSSVPVAQGPRRPDSQSRRSPPSLYFHHWVPPAQPHSGATLGKAHQEPPGASSNPRRPDHQTSPGRKRKAPGPHQPAPTPSSRSPGSLPGVSHTPRPGSPRNYGQQVGRSRHRHQPSDTSVSHGSYQQDHVKAEFTERISPPQVSTGVTASARDTASLARNRDSTDQARSGDASPLEQTDKLQVLQAPYASSIETGARDSDLESSPQQSPTLGTPLASTQLSSYGGG
ncbi:hypothetical protein BDW59DRAFT_1816 [Aspergillus cavernicola]|uniref:Uncharacterized protein n=1 Tax=Aspergillus cavernicola TaxID=176166 RepID=A0ABR4J4K4_9EURO